MTTKGPVRKSIFINNNFITVDILFCYCLFQFHGKSFLLQNSLINARAKIKPGSIQKVSPMIRSGIPSGISVQPRIIFLHFIFIK